jgi:Na+-translocating ferredoxin:NAD+ oxidoreductase RNF subunit RnfB
MNVIITTLILSLVMAFVLGFLLGFFKKMFHVPVDERVSNVRAVLPGANCGACGYPGCDGFAAAVVAGDAPANGCAAGGPSVAEAVGKVVGSAVSAEVKVALIACRGTKEVAIDKGTYVGLHSCAAAKLSTGGTKACPYGCIGFGDCAQACKFGALHIGADGLPVIDREKCTGCAACTIVCPNRLLVTVPVNRKGAIALCSNHTTNKPSVLKACKAGCIKCGMCEKNCPNGAIKLVNGIPQVDYTKCVACGTCANGNAATGGTYKGCPTKALALLSA